jgi:hypothetical protein
VGAEVTLLRLGDHGATGNGHGMIFERNHREALSVVMDALQPILSVRADPDDGGTGAR